MFTAVAIYTPVLHTMVDCPHIYWHGSRKLHTTATKNAEHAGVSKYHKPKTITLQILVYPGHVLKATLHLKRGVDNEWSIIQEFVTRHGFISGLSPLLIDPLHQPEGATSDAMAWYDPLTCPHASDRSRMYEVLEHQLCSIEAKCPVNVPDHPPAHYLVQCLKQMKILTVTHGYLITSDTVGRRRNWRIWFSMIWYEWIIIRSTRSVYHLASGRITPSFSVPHIYEHFQAFIDVGGDYDKYTKVRWPKEKLPRDALPSEPIRIELVDDYKLDTSVCEGWDKIKA